MTERCGRCARLVDDRDQSNPARRSETIKRVVLLRKPVDLTADGLDFRMPSLPSRRMLGVRPDSYRILTNCGRAVFRANGADLQERHRVTHTEVNAACIPQTWSHCGWVEKVNRR